MTNPYRASSPRLRAFCRCDANVPVLLSHTEKAGKPGTKLVHEYSTLHAPHTQMLPGGAAGALSALTRFPVATGDMMEEEPLYVNAKQYHRFDLLAVALSQDEYESCKPVYEDETKLITTLISHQVELTL